jgi:S-DNA-T family DNA segregation ATPase FtsK/SpoIIIE
MARMARKTGGELVAEVLRTAWEHPSTVRFRGGLVAGFGLVLVAAFASYSAADPSLNTASEALPANWLGLPGALIADLALQSLGITAVVAAMIVVAIGLTRLMTVRPISGRRGLRRRALFGGGGVVLAAAAFSAGPTPEGWQIASGLGGLWGDSLLRWSVIGLEWIGAPDATLISASAFGFAGGAALIFATGLVQGLVDRLHEALRRPDAPALATRKPARKAAVARPLAFDPAPDFADEDDDPPFDLTPAKGAAAAPLNIRQPKAPRESGRAERENQGAFEFVKPGGFQMPELNMLAKPKPRSAAFDEGSLRQNAQLLESVLAEFGVRGQIDQIRPGPVVTLYELVPAAGVKHARVVALSDDIARSMSVAACRVSVVGGRNAIGIELPNAKRETVYLRDLLASPEYEKGTQALPVALGEGIGGEPYVADLSKMPHLLVAGTTGSGKSVGVNAMILSILYRLPPDKCRFIMIDPKMLELSVYDGIPHLLAPVVTDPKKAIVALKWTVREMEDRYRRMSKIGVRNVASYNERAAETAAKGEHFERTVQTGFDEGGRPIYETEQINPEPMPFIVVIIDEMADLMLTAGKDIEGAVQRLAQMARAAGIHVVMATQRPSVDVITGTIKANFPTRISYQVTSKIDSRTILGEQGAEQLLGMGDLLYMAGGGRVTRLHGPFVSDGEVEAVAKFLRDQGTPQYLEEITAVEEEGEDGELAFAGGDGGGNDLYDQAVAIVTRDGKASTSYVQRRLQIGYNRAASLIERMEREGVVSAANHAGKREILAGPPP